MEEISTTTVHFWLDGAGILHAEARPGMIDTMETNAENHAAIRTLCGDQQRLLLVDIRGAADIPTAIRFTYRHPEMRALFAALAFVVDSQASRDIANFFVTLNSTTVPTAVFDSEDQALAWLRPFVPLL